MFEFLFKYPRNVFDKGNFVFLNAWPVWLLWLGVAVAAAVFGFLIWRKNGTGSPVKNALVWLLQTGMAALLLFMLWRPALSISQLKPQQNIVAVIVDDSSSMAAKDEGGGLSRKDRGLKVLSDGLLDKLKEKFQVRIYKMSDHLTRVENTGQFNAQAPVTHIGTSLKQVVADASSLPIGAMVLVSDGADNTGGVDLETLAEVRRHQIPIHTIGLGREQMEHDVEVVNVELPQRALPNSRLNALVAFHQHGYTGQKAKITIRDNNKVLAAQEVTLKAEGSDQIEQVLFNAGPAGVKTIQTFIEPLANEENTRNNIVTRMVNVDRRKPRILYLEGEPRWEFKFIRRGVEDDDTIDLLTVLRTAPNKKYIQGNVPDAKLKEELDKGNGFPTTVESLFAFDAIMFGSVDAPYLSPQQLQNVKDFVDRRGGGLIFLGGKDALAEGGWQSTPVNEVLPVTLPDKKGTFHWTPANVRLTPQGAESLITRIEDDPKKNEQRFEKLPYIRNVQNIGTPKLGALVLAEAVPMNGGGGAMPLLVTMNYGRGRSAVFATSGSWRWQMLQDVSDKSHEMFYQQFLRWVMADSPHKVTGSTPKTLLADESTTKLRAEVKDKAYLPATDAIVEAHILGTGVADTLTMAPDPNEAGAFTADWSAPQQGDYVVEVVATRNGEELGRDAFTVRREDGMAENFHVEQNRALLEKLSSETKGNYYKPDDAQQLAKDIEYSPAGISVRETRDLWNMPALFLGFLVIRAAEWLLRRKWGTI